MKVLITGGREFWNRAQIEADLRALLPQGLNQIVHGHHHKGADFLADLVGELLLGREGVLRHPADWSEGKRGGLLRNITMLDTERPNLVLAYPDPKSRGTWHCVVEAAARDIPVLAFLPWEGDLVELVDRSTRRYGKVVTGARKGSHVVIHKG